MCLIVLTRKNSFETTKRPIICYKKLSGNNSIYTNYVYLKNVENPIVKLEKKELYYSRSKVCIEEGYHSWVYPISMEHAATDVFIIPKNTEYICGTVNGESKGYVSENIIYVGKIWNPVTWVNVLKYKLL